MDGILSKPKFREALGNIRVSSVDITDARKLIAANPALTPAQAVDLVHHADAIKRDAEFDMRSQIKCACLDATGLCCREDFWREAVRAYGVADRFGFCENGDYEFRTSIIHRLVRAAGFDPTNQSAIEMAIAELGVWADAWQGGRD